jgi:hypothetical protein
MIRLRRVVSIISLLCECVFHFDFSPCLFPSPKRGHITPRGRTCRSPAHCMLQDCRRFRDKLVISPPKPFLKKKTPKRKKTIPPPKVSFYSVSYCVCDIIATTYYLFFGDDVNVGIQDACVVKLCDFQQLLNSARIRLRKGSKSRGTNPISCRPCH